MTEFRFGFMAWKCPLCLRFQIQNKDLPGEVLGIHLRVCHTELDKDRMVLCTNCDRSSPWQENGIWQQETIKTTHSDMDA